MRSSRARTSPERRVFQGFGADRFRTAIARACNAGGVPSFSPHDLRHRRISLEHLRGQPWGRIRELVGQRNLAVTANTHTHVLVNETEIDYAALVRWWRQFTGRPESPPRHRRKSEGGGALCATRG